MASIANRVPASDVPAINALAGWASALARKGAAEYALEPVTFILHHPRSSAARARELSEQLRAELEAQLTPEQIRDIELLVAALSRWPESCENFWPARLFIDSYLFSRRTSLPVVQRVLLL